MSKKFLTVVLVVLFANTVFSQSTQKDFSKTEFSKTDLTNQLLSGKDSTDKKVSLNTSVSKKSGGVAMLLSLLLPGAGHFYIDRMDVGKFFVMGEAASWLGFAGLNIYGNALREDARTFASENAGLDKSGKDDDYYVNVANFNSIYDYNNDKLLTGEYSQLYNESTHYWNWNNNTTNKDTYDQQRLKSERVYNTRILFGTTLFVNRIVSAISALILANKSSDSKAINFQPELLQKNYGVGVDGIKLNISKNF